LYFVLKMRGLARFFLLVLTVLALVGLLGVPAMDAQAEARQDDAARTSMVLSIVTGIINYTRWPRLEGTLQICLVGESDYFEISERLSTLIQSVIGASASLTALKNPEEEGVLQCNLVYVGSVKEYDTRQLLSSISGQPILSIGEDQDFCSLGGMFCLDLDDPKGVTFSTNLDAVSRSKVRVNPQVLRLAERLKAAP